MAHPTDQDPKKLALLLTQEQRVYSDDFLDVRTAASGSHLMAVLREGAGVMARGALQTFSPTPMQRRALAGMSLLGLVGFLGYAIVIKNGIDDGPYEGVDLAHAIAEVHQSTFGPSALAGLGRGVQVEETTARHAFAVATPKAIPPVPERLEDAVAAALREAGVMSYEDAAQWFTANGLTGPAIQDALFQHGLYFNDEVGEYAVVAYPEESNKSAPTLDSLRALIEGLADTLYAPTAQIGAMLDDPLDTHMKMTIDCSLGSTTRCLEERVGFVGKDDAVVVVSFDSRDGGRVRMDDEVTNLDEIGEITRMHASSFTEDGAPAEDGASADKVAMASSI